MVVSSYQVAFLILICQNGLSELAQCLRVSSKIAQMVVARWVVVIIMYCPADVLAEATGLRSVVGFMRWETALLVCEHFEVVTVSIRLPDLICGLSSGPFFEDVILIVAILCPTMLVAFASTGQCNCPFVEVLLQSWCHPSWCDCKEFSTMDAGSKVGSFNLKLRL